MYWYSQHNLTNRKRVVCEHIYTNIYVAVSRSRVSKRILARHKVTCCRTYTIINIYIHSITIMSRCVVYTCARPLHDMRRVFVGARSGALGEMWRFSLHTQQFILMTRKCSSTFGIISFAKAKKKRLPACEACAADDIGIITWNYALCTFLCVCVFFWVIYTNSCANERSNTQRLSWLCAEAYIMREKLRGHSTRGATAPSGFCIVVDVCEFN